MFAEKDSDFYLSLLYQSRLRYGEESSQNVHNLLLTGLFQSCWESRFLRRQEPHIN